MLKHSVFEQSLESLPIGVAIYSLAGDCIYCNSKTYDFLQYSKPEFLKISFNHWFADVDISKVFIDNNVELKQQIQKNNRHFKVTASLMGDEYLQLTFIENTYEQSLETELSLSQENVKQLNDAVTGANIGCWDFYPKEERILANKNWVLQKKYKDTDLRVNDEIFSEVINGLGKWAEMIHPDDLNPTLKIIEQHLAGETEVYDATFRMMCGDGQWRWFHDIGQVYERDKEGNAIRMNGVHVDITQSKNLEQRIHKLLTTDELTNVMSRRYFEKHFKQLLADCKKNNEYLAFLLLDIDYFKRFNDTYGHLAGDKALVLIGDTINSCLQREGDACFRMGGEEFAIIYQVKNEESAQAFSQNIKESIAQLKIPHTSNSVAPYITVSMGLVYKKATEDCNLSAKEIYHSADILLYEAKSSGRNTIKY